MNRPNINKTVFKKIYEISKNYKGTKHFTSVYKYYRYNYVLYCNTLFIGQHQNTFYN